MNFETDYIYTDRETKAKFVYEKYKSILKGKILDVGADQCTLRNYLPADVEYVGIGLGGNESLIVVNLETEEIPFEENSFDCVLCLDVLEHLENIHAVFDKLCKVTKQWLVISLPNPWSNFMNFLQQGKYSEDRNIKFYGLPKERDKDRHKWFYSSSEAKAFVNYRAQKNHMQLCDLFIENQGSDGLSSPKNWFERKERNKVKRARRRLFRKDLSFSEIFEGTQWYVLKRQIVED